MLKTFGKAALSFFYAIVLISFSLTTIGQMKMGRDLVNSIEILKKNTNKKELVKKLWSTELLNADAIYENLNLDHENHGFHMPLRGAVKYRNGLSFRTLNPYFPRFTEILDPNKGPTELRYGEVKSPWAMKVDNSLRGQKKKITHSAQEQVVRWYSEIQQDTPASRKVCAFKFLDEQEKKYRLQSFSKKEEAVSEGYHVTHQYGCGTCSSLRDLAVYIAKPDLTSPVRHCVQKLTLIGIKKCLMEKVGLSEQCAETWAYNGDNTKLLCTKTCLKHYGEGSLIKGVFNALSNNFKAANNTVDANGNTVLNSCIACDEGASGKAFLYTARRNRRTSGLESMIKRDATEKYSVNHYEYFDFFRKKGQSELGRLRKDFDKIN